MEVVPHNGVSVLPDGSAFFVAEVPAEPRQWTPIAEGLHEAIQWNPYNRVVQDHRDGTIHPGLTNQYRAARGLPVPWSVDICERELGLK